MARRPQPTRPLSVRPVGRPARTQSELALLDERRPKQPSAAELRQLYHGDGLSTYQIAERLGVAGRTVGRWLANYGIAARPPGAPAAAEPTPLLGTRKAVRPWLRLSEGEQAIVRRQIDEFLTWAAVTREPAP